MRNLALVAGLFAALPLAAQQPAPAPTDGQQPKLEAPTMAAPEPEAAKPKPAPVVAPVLILAIAYYQVLGSPR